MKGPGTIRARWETDDGSRQAILNRIRLCAALTVPSTLPPLGHTADVPLPDAYQSLGHQGIKHLESRVLTAIHPPSEPWFQLVMAPQDYHNPDIPDDVKARVDHELFLRELILQGLLESATLYDGRHRRRSAFRTARRQAIGQILVTGDTLEHLDDDFRLRVFRRDQYVTARDSAGDVLYHITREEIDPLSLSEEQFEQTRLRREDVMNKRVDERMEEMVTLVEWQPQSRVWLIEQEVNGHVINRSEETISPYFSTAYDLPVGEDYGRGLAEEVLGELRTLNRLELALIDLMGLASKNHPVLDYGAAVREEDMTLENGMPFRARVEGGRVQDVAFLETAQVREYQMLSTAIAMKRQYLAQTFWLESAVTPRGDRVTATQAQRIGTEVEAGLGGIYSAVADDMHLPLLRRTIHLAERKRLIKPMPKNRYEIRTLTGIEALGRQARMQRMLQVVQIIAQLGQEAMKRINQDVLMDVLLRYGRIVEPGLIKTNEQVAAERQEAIALETQQAAAEQAVKTGGNILEAAAMTGEQQ